jgi:predicted N-formylglutamate amidohydrolase
MSTVRSIPGVAQPPFVVLCEHASNHLPDGLPWGPDAWVSEMHWAWDPGAAELVEDLCARTGAPAVLAGFSRLYADPNRPLDSETLFRRVCDGRVLALNAWIDDIDRTRRLAHYHAYHAAADHLVSAHPGAMVVSMHTFTDSYEGRRRDVEVGVLYDRQPELGRFVARHLAHLGDVRENEPWSGLAGLMFSPQSHADAHGRAAVELEVRQDLATNPAYRARFCDALAAALLAAAAEGLDRP